MREHFFCDLEVSKSDAADGAPQGIPEEQGRHGELTTPLGLLVDLKPHQAQGLYWMVEQERSAVRGGVLADDMGLGKTVQCLALLLSDPTNHQTLVVCPISLVLQWEAEIRDKAPSVRYCIYHGPDRLQKVHFQAYDAVLTTYGVLRAECPSLTLHARPPRLATAIGGKVGPRPTKRHRGMEQPKGPLFLFDWHRVILDEGHEIRNHRTHSNHACCQLSATHRWVLTGTPIHNRPQDYFALLKFLRFKPYDQYDLWTQFIEKGVIACVDGVAPEELALQRADVLDQGLPRLRHLIRRTLLRRTKTGLINGKPILSAVPEKVVHPLQPRAMQPHEAEYYCALAAFCHQKFCELRPKYYTNRPLIQELLLRMRQACNHPALMDLRALADVEDFDAEAAAAQSHFPDMPRFAPPPATSAKVRAPYCVTSRCSGVAASSTAAEGTEGLRAAADSPASPDRIAAAISKPQSRFWWGHSTKIREMLERLADVQAEATAGKVIIFSQWASMLTLLERALADNGWAYVRFDGSMSLADRGASLHAFKHDPAVPILLATLKAAGVGLDLSVANVIFLLDMWWTPAAEEQAIDRVHRIGQCRTVQVFRFATQNTVEGKLLQLQTAKRRLVAGALSAAEPADGIGKAEFGQLFNAGPAGAPRGGHPTPAAKRPRPSPASPASPANGGEASAQSPQPSDPLPPSPSPQEAAPGPPGPPPPHDRRAARLTADCEHDTQRAALAAELARREAEAAALGEAGAAGGEGAEAEARAALCAQVEAARQALLRHDDEGRWVWADRDAQDGRATDAAARATAEAIRAAVLERRRQQREEQRRRQELEQERLQQRRAVLAAEQRRAAAEREQDKQYHSAAERQRRREAEVEQLRQFVALQERRRQELAALPTPAPPPGGGPGPPAAPPLQVVRRVVPRGSGAPPRPAAHSPEQSPATAAPPPWVPPGVRAVPYETAPDTGPSPYARVEQSPLEGVRRVRRPRPTSPATPGPGARAPEAVPPAP